MFCLARGTRQIILYPKGSGKSEMRAQKGIRNAWLKIASLRGDVAMVTRTLVKWIGTIVAGIFVLSLGSGSAQAIVFLADGTPDPTDSHLKLWLDASDLGTLFQDPAGTQPVTAQGQTVGLWKDKSTSQVHVSEATYKPTYVAWTPNLNLHPALHFDADKLQATNATGITGNADRTVITVWANAVNTGQNFQHTFHMGTPSADQAYGISVSRNSNNRIGNHYWSGSFNTAMDGNAVPRVAMAVWDGDGGTAGNGLDSWYVDGRSAGANDRAALNTGTQQLLIGSRLSGPSEGIRGDVAEVLVYDHALSTVEQQQLGRYLTTKYRLNTFYLGDGNVYEVVSAPTGITWTAARAAAQALAAPAGYNQGDLVSIGNLRENRAVASLIDTSAWIGANDEASEGTWVWSDGSGQFWQGTSGGTSVRGQFSRWNTGEPNNAGGSEDYAEIIRGTGVWNDLSSTHTRTAYVVKFTPNIATTADFDGADDAYTLTQYGNSPAADIRNDDATSNYLRLLHNAGSQQNVAAFDRTAPGSYGRITASFDFRLDPGADGMGFALLNTDNYGVTGAGPSLGAWEEPNLTNSFGAGFDIYSDIHEVSLHYGSTKAAVSSPFDYRTGSTGDFNRAEISLDFVHDGAYVSLSVGETAVYTDHFIAGMTPYEARVALGARTGGTYTTLDVDNLDVQYLRDTIEWGGGTGNYNDAAMWAGGRTPSIADHAAITAGQANASGLVVNGSGSVIVAGTGTLNNTGTLWIGQTAGSEGNFYQRGGTVQTDTVYLAGAADASGVYEMTGGTLNLGSYLVVGHSGPGIFLQAGGTVNQTVNNTILGDVSGSHGSLYELSGGTLNANVLSIADKADTTATFQVLDSGVLNTAGTTYVGTNGVGLLSLAGTETNRIRNNLQVGQNAGAVGMVQHSSGTLTVDNWLVVGENTGATGTYEISGDAVLNVGGQYFMVGRNGKGTFTQSGNSVVNFNGSGRLMICDFSNAAGSAYVMNGGTLNVNGGKLLAVGKGAAGEFVHNGGTVNATGDLSLAESGTGTYRLNGGTLNVTDNMVYGTGTGSFELNGGTLNLAGNVTNGGGRGDFLFDSGTFNFTGTSIDVDGFRMGTAGSANPTFALGTGQSLRASDDLIVGQYAAATLTLDGATVTTGDYFWVGQNAGGNGTVLQTGGSVTVGNRLAISDHASAQGSYTIGGDGTLTINGDYLIVGRQGPGSFVQNDNSVVTFNGSARILLADITGSSGSSYTLNGGTLNVNNGRQISVGKSGTALFTQTGGVVNAHNSTLRLNEGGSQGTYQLQGGVLHIGTIQGSDAAFEFTGGTLHADNVQFALTNEGGILGPGHSAGTTLIDGAYTQESTGILAIELGGLVRGTEYDWLDVNGEATLAGSLEVSLIEGFVPTRYDRFDVVTATSIALDPAFSFEAPEGLADNNVFVMGIVDGGPRGQILRLTVIPEPASCLLFVLGALGLLFPARRNARHR